MTKKERVPESNRIRQKHFDISTKLQKKNAFQNPIAFDKNILIFQRNGKLLGSGQWDCLKHIVAQVLAWPNDSSIWGEHNGPPNGVTQWTTSWGKHNGPPNGVNTVDYQTR